MAFPASKRKEYVEYHPQQRAHSREMVFKLNITSIIDIFTILIVFLLKSFSTQGELFTLSPDLNLPDAYYANMIKKQTTAVAVTNDYILVDGEKIEDLRQQDIEDEPTLVLPKLLAKLEFLKSTMIKTYGKDPGFVFLGRVTILGDKKIPFSILERVIYTCGQAEFNRINLAVIHESML
jgi:biopolymer transport protein ExbD